MAFGSIRFNSANATSIIAALLAAMAIATGVFFGWARFGIRNKDLALQTGDTLPGHKWPPW